MQQFNDGISEIHSHEIRGPEKVATALVGCQVEDHNKIMFVELILEKVNDIWHLIQLGCTDEVLKIVRLEYVIFPLEHSSLL